MCQMSIMLEKDDHLEKVMENATALEVTAQGIRISTLFEEPKVLPDTAIKKIDFLDGLVILTAR